MGDKEFPTRGRNIFLAPLDNRCSAKEGVVCQEVQGKTQKVGGLNFGGIN